MLTQITVLWTCLRVRFVDPVRTNEEGSTVETVIITALFAAMAIVVGTIIVLKVTSKANSIDLN